MFVAFIEPNRSFDYIHRDMHARMILYKLLIIKQNRRKVVRITLISIYSSSFSWNNERFTGVRQGVNLSPTFFSGFAYAEVNDLNNRISVWSTKPLMLLNADEAVRVSGKGTDLQLMLDIINNGCSRWRVIFNANKSKDQFTKKPVCFPQRRK